MEYVIGGFGTRATVEIINRQQSVDVNVISGYASEADIRSFVGNYNKDTYGYFYSGLYYSRKGAVQRLEYDIEEAKKSLERLEFSLKVTKKKNWNISQL